MFVICAYPFYAGAMDNATQMMLARAMSIPLATVLFQSLMGGQQMAAPPPVFQPAPVMQPSSQPQSPMMNPALLQMMQQAFQVLILSIVLPLRIFSVASVCESVCNALTFESLDLESAFVCM